MDLHECDCSTVYLCDTVLSCLLGVLLQPLWLVCLFSVCGEQKEGPLEGCLRRWVGQLWGSKAMVADSTVLSEILLPNET